MSKLFFDSNVKRHLKDCDKANKVLVGIVDAINGGLYVKGYRNNMAVDMGISCCCLGIDPFSLCERLPIDGYCIDDLKRRLSRISGYIDEWDNSQNIWDFAMMPDEWILWYDNTEDHYLEIQ